MTYDRPVVITPAVFPTRLVKAYSVSSLDDISAWSMVISHWRMSSTGDRGYCWNFSSIWRNYCTQHGRLASRPLLVCHLFLDSCSCKFLFKISAFILNPKWWTKDFYIMFAPYILSFAVFSKCYCQSCCIGIPQQMSGEYRTMVLQSSFIIISWYWTTCWTLFHKKHTHLQQFEKRYNNDNGKQWCDSMLT